MKRFFTGVALFLALALPAQAQLADRPITLYSGYPAGGMVDIVARLQ